MPQYGIDWDKVDAKNAPRLNAQKPTVTAVTEQGATARSTRAKREAKPDTVARSTRNPKPVKEPVEVTEAVSAAVTGEVVEPDEDDIDTEPEDESGEKV